MSKLPDFQQAALDLAEQRTGPEWLQPLRQSGADAWLRSEWPHRRTEAWKYTPLKPLQNRGYAQWAGVDTADVQQALSDVALIEGDCVRLVFVNGSFAPELSSKKLPSGVTRFSDADASQKTLIQQNLGKIVDTDRHLFAALSNAWASDGVLLHVPANQYWQTPVYVVHLSTPTAEAAVSAQRLLVVLESGAQTSVIEHFVSTSQTQNGFVNALTEVSVGSNATLHHSRLNMEQQDLLHVGGVHVDLAQDARMNGFTLAQGGRLKRIDYQVNHRGENADLVLNGVYLPRQSQIVDYHTNIEHCVPRCTTSETFRGIVADESRAVFNGRIHIHPQAQKTLAELSNKNLLTSNRAEVDTKPELEIYADDVQCAHGATVSQLDATSMYYLQSRGISRAEAEVILSFGFINELLSQAPEQAVQAYLRPRLATLFGQPEVLARHLQGEVTHE